MFWYTTQTFTFNFPLEIIKIWHGGMSFHGGFIVQSLVHLLYARNEK
nr:prolipoprotein diacylglyceryl transferase family protein [Anaplasma phagocytophilum]